MTSREAITGLVPVVDGASARPSVALLRDGALVARIDAPRGRGARGDLFGALREALQSSGAEIRDVSGIAVSTGPGSFTGVRVALSLVEGLRLARPQLPVAGIDALRALIRAAQARPPLTVALPWGRLRVMLAEVSPEGELPRNAVVVPRETLAGRASLRGAHVVVPPALEAERWPPAAEVVVAPRPASEGMAELLSKGEAPLVAGALPRPLYLVPPDAVLPSRRGRLPGGLRFERLEPPALSELVELEHACFEDPWSPELLAEELAPREDRLALGARDEEGTLVAAGLARLGRDDMSILSVATRPSSRRRGLGRALVRALLEEARRRDLARVDLEVRTTNRPAILLYASEGFVPVGRRPRYYRDGTDALLFSLLLRRGAQGGS